jgi:beta-galactosidase
VDAGTVTARVAIAWDAARGWAMRAAVLPSADLDYAAEVAAAHRALWWAGHTRDLVAPDDDLSGVVPAGTAVRRHRGDPRTPVGRWRAGPR